MIGMHFGAFLTLLIVSFIAAIIMHFAIRYRMLGSVDGFFAKWIAGWIGAWLGGPVLGYWAFQIQNIYIIPAFVGAFVGAFSFVAVSKSTGLATMRTTATKATTSSVVPEAVRKAS